MTGLLGDLPAEGSGLDYSDMGANERKSATGLTTLQSVGDTAKASLFGASRALSGYIQEIRAEDLARRDRQFNVDPAEDPAGALIDPKEWTAKYPDLGLNFTPDMGQAQAQLLVDHRQEQLRREYVLDHAPNTLFAKSARTMTEFALGAVDPVNLAAVFVPGIGETRAGLLAAKFGKTIGRTIEGGVAGGAGMAALQPLEYAESQAYQDHYGPMDAFANIAFGTVLGGGLHAGFGKISDFFDRAAPETREAAMRGAVANLAEGRAVDVEPILQSDPNLTSEPPARPTPPPTPVEPAISQEDLAAAHQDVKTSRAAMPNEPSLFNEIRSLGGIKMVDEFGKPQAGAAEIRQIMDTNRSLTNNKTGRPPDMMREALHERGWFGGNRDTSQSDLGDLHALIGHEAKQGKVYHPESEIHGQLAYRQLLERETSEAGIIAADKPEVAAKKLAEYRASRRAQDLADFHEQAAKEDISGLSSSDLEALYSHGYEPGSDIGAEFETGGQPGAGGFDAQGARGPQDFAGRTPGNNEGLGQAGGRGAISPEARQSIDRARQQSIDFAKGREPSSVSATAETQAHAESIIKAGDDPKAELQDAQAQLQGYKAQGIVTEADQAALDAANAADAEAAKSRTDAAAAAARCLFLHP